MHLTLAPDPDPQAPGCLRHRSIGPSEAEDDQPSSLDADQDKDKDIDGPPDQPRHTMIDEDDDDVQMAISALSVMKTGGPSFGWPASPHQPHPSGCPAGITLPQPVRQLPSRTFLTQPKVQVQHNHYQPQSPHSPRPSPGPPSPHSPPEQIYLDAYGKPVDANGHPVDVVQIEDPEGGVFLQRVGRMPLVSGVVRAYERGKGTSRVVKYGADLVESSVTSLSGKVASTVGPERIAQIDRYAGAALDRLGQISGIQSQTTPSDSQQPTSRPHDGSDYEALDQSGLRGRNMAMIPRSHLYPNQMDIDHCSSHSQSPSRAQQQEVPGIESDLETPAASPGGRLVQVASSGRSRWQNMLVEAGMTAGGIGAAVSEESMKSLKYCLHWLQYATAHLDHQITLLRDFIGSLTVSGRSSHALISPGAVDTLAKIKKEVVETIRKVVDIVSKYAGGALPEQAKQFVREKILSLPIKWASTIQAENSLNTRPDSRSGNLGDGNVTRGKTEIVADRILSFAVEGLDMLKSVTGTFAESVDRADAWVERLRIIGIQHRQQRAEDEAVQDRDPRNARCSIPARSTRKRSESCQAPFGPANSDSLVGFQTTASSSAASCSRDNTFRRSRAIGSRDSSTSTSWGGSSISGEPFSATTTTTSASEHHPVRLSVKRRKANGGLAQAAYTTNTTSVEMIGAFEEGGLEERSNSSLKRLLNHRNVDDHEDWEGWSEY